nr:Period circadian protein like protein 1 [Haemonchus contortus]
MTSAAPDRSSSHHQVESTTENLESNIQETRRTTRVDGYSLSPPHTWSDSTEQDEDTTESRHLFTVVVTLPEGDILDSRVVSDSISAETLQRGNRFFSCLHGKGQSILLSAAATSVRQRIFARVNCGVVNHACELMCEFEPKRARITAMALRAAFGPSTPFHSLTFTTKHAASCALTHIDYTSIPYLGHLPTDLIGRSILAFVYAPDVHVVRQAHVDLHNSRGRVVKSVAPLRFVAYNGALLRAETEWSAYVNPWTKKIDMVVARHRIIDAPIGDANVLDAPANGQALHVLPPPMAKTFEDELRCLMNKPVSSCRGNGGDSVPVVGMCDAVGRPANLGAYIDRLVETLVVNSTGSPQQQQQQQRMCSTLANIQVKEEQPDLPLSYNQINCLENVHRLLKSQSRPETPTKCEQDDSTCSTTASIPLTREVLQAHTRRWEEQYRDTWHRRLKRMSAEVLPGTPAHKHMRPASSCTPPAHWPTAKREEFYRSLAPNPPPPPGINFQITTIPLPPVDEKSTTPTSTTGRSSAFTTVAPKGIPLRELPTPIALSIQDHGSVIQMPSEPLIVPREVLNQRLQWAYGVEPSSLKQHTKALRLLHESA